MSEDSAKSRITADPRATTNQDVIQQSPIAPKRKKQRRRPSSSCSNDSNDDPSGSSPSSNASNGPYTSRDILLGRGGLANKHTGNRVFRRLVNQNKAMYKDMNTKRRALLIRSMLEAFEKHGMRFLKQQGGKGSAWVEVTRDEAWTKTSKAFQEPDEKPVPSPNKRPGLASRASFSSTHSADSNQSSTASLIQGLKRGLVLPRTSHHASSSEFSFDIDQDTEESEDADDPLMSSKTAEVAFEHQQQQQFLYPEDRAANDLLGSSSELGYFAGANDAAPHSWSQTRAVPYHPHQHRGLLSGAQSAQSGATLLEMHHGSYSNHHHSSSELVSQSYAAAIASSSATRYQLAAHGSRSFSEGLSAAGQTYHQHYPWQSSRAAEFESGFGTSSPFARPTDDAFYSSAMMAPPSTTDDEIYHGYQRGLEDAAAIYESAASQKEAREAFRMQQVKALLKIPPFPARKSQEDEEVPPKTSAAIRMTSLGEFDELGQSMSATAEGEGHNNDDLPLMPPPPDQQGAHQAQYRDTTTNDSGHTDTSEDEAMKEDDSTATKDGTTTVSC